MALTETTTFFLLFGLLINSVCSENVQCDNILNGTQNNNNNTQNYTISLSPNVIQANQTYTVTVTGSGNVTVLLQATANSMQVGNWSSGDTDCNGSPLFNDPFKSENSSLIANWTLANAVDSVTISASILNGTDLFKISEVLSSPVTSAPDTNQTTTKAPDSTLNPNSTVTTIPQTTNAVSAQQSCSTLFALVQTVGLLFITSKTLL
ncbi:placenta-expressed transcript 1 protein [Bombina bombina]|uniref:placenta-expressed transcript 1 protein n=1 Tax=Bombina bombina TaxID=8345 RepID=UPI00235A7299|nr:placenta-expressed transcript 1 protein [Bombina bombina]